MNKKIATGILLLFIGTVVLLHNLHIIDFNFFAALRLWPLILVSIGISFLFQNRKNGAWIIAISNIIICSIFFYKGVTGDETMFGNISIVNDEDDSEFIPANAVGLIKAGNEDRVRLTINGGAAKFVMNDKISPDSLMRASTRSQNSSISLVNSGDKNQELTLNNKVRSSKSGNNSILVNLNNSAIWDLEYNVGAANIDADFRNLKIGSLEINSGAMSMDMHLPAPIEGTNNIEISTAASKIILYLPKGAACRVETESFLSNNKFEGVDLKMEDYRQSTNYEQASSRYHIKVEGAANSLSILRY